MMKSRKSICIVDFDYSVCGGVEKVTASLANELSDCCDVWVLSVCMGTDEMSFPLSENVHFENLAGKPDRLRYLKKAAKQKLPGFYKEHGIEFVIFQGNYAGYVCGTIGRTKGVRTAFFDHGALMNQWDRKDIRFIRWRCSKKCDYVITLTEESRKDYRERFHLPDRKVKCIYNWIDDTLPASEKYDDRSKRILSAGRFTYEKGFDHLVKIFAPAAKKHPDWHLDIFGDGEERGKIEGLIREYGMEDNIHLKGMVSDLYARYGEYAMYVLPSYREGMPLVLLEAKYNRLPIISFDVRTGPKEIVTDGVDGILIEPCDTEKMTAAILKLMEDPELRISMSEHSQDNTDRFSRTRIREQWIGLIEEETK